MQENNIDVSVSAVSMRDLFNEFLKIGLLSFGGPAGQIALMHRVIVDERKWLDEQRFLHALNFCMLLPGPEAMQLATYSGWLLKGVKGGLVAGGLFVLPGAIVIGLLSWLYITLGQVPVVDGLLFGLKAAVLAIVIQALAKVASRALKQRLSWVIAGLAFVALWLFQLPFPLVVLLSGLIGFLFPTLFGNDAVEVFERTSGSPSHLMKVVFGTLVFWLIPLAVLFIWLGQGNVFVDMATFFSTAAIVTFGGAYAVLAYVAQQAVETYGWLKPDEMITGLGLAETTPGPLILVLEFVGFVGGWREASGMPALVGGVLGALVTLWVTFTPCFIWIFAGAPYIEQLRGNQKLTSALSAITAAVVGVIANLSLWFGIHVLFGETKKFHFLTGELNLPILQSLDWRAGVIAVVSGILVWQKASLFWILGTAVVLGILFKTQI